MIRRFCLALLCFGLAACALQEEIILEEPIMEEEIAREGVPDCENSDEDGIGGTGCEPVARQQLYP